MKKIAAIAALLGGVACGGGGSEYSGPFRATVGAAPFTPVETVAVILPPAPCVVLGFTANVSGLLIDAGSFTGVCDFVTPISSCGGKASSTFVEVGAIKLGLTSVQGAVGPGTYVVTSSPTPDASGNATFAGGTEYKTGAWTGSTCPITSNSLATSGSLEIQTIGASNVTGRIHGVRFQDGDSAEGTFDATLCPLTIDTCAYVNCTVGACYP